MSFCIDTSGLIDGWVRMYPPQTFPSLWVKIEQSISTGDVFAPENVLVELSAKDDDLHKWAKIQSSLFISVDTEIQTEVASIVAAFPDIHKGGRNMADPFVVAAAKIKRATLITGEKLGKKSEIKIPNLCAHCGVYHINILEFIQRMGWKF